MHRVLYEILCTCMLTNTCLSHECYTQCMCSACQDNIHVTVIITLYARQKLRVECTAHVAEVTGK